MNHNPLLGPVVALVAWTLIMLIVAAVRIIRGSRDAGPIEDLPPNPRGKDFEGRIPDQHLWSRRNYEHLVEQPTLFYAIVLALVAMGDRIQFNLWLAWAYVAIRIGHSLAQSLGKARGPWFGLSTLCLVALTLHAGMALLDIHH